MQNRRNPIDLSANMAVCDANYIRILKLLPGFALGACRKVVLPSLGPLHALSDLPEGLPAELQQQFPVSTAATPVEAADGELTNCLVQLRVEEAFRYTSTVSIRFVFTGDDNPYFRPPELFIRLYHDACTAEVTSYQNQGRFHLQAAQGDRPEFTPDEKQQVNTFLAEWLILCLDHGLSHRVAHEVFRPVQPISLQ